MRINRLFHFPYADLGFADLVNDGCRILLDRRAASAVCAHDLGSAGLEPRFPRRRKVPQEVSHQVRVDGPFWKTWDRLRCPQTHLMVSQCHQIDPQEHPLLSCVRDQAQLAHWLCMVSVPFVMWSLNGCSSFKNELHSRDGEGVPVSIRVPSFSRPFHAFFSSPASRDFPISPHSIPIPRAPHAPPAAPAAPAPCTLPSAVKRSKARRQHFRIKPSSVSSAPSSLRHRSSTWCFWGPRQKHRVAFGEPGRLFHRGNRGLGDVNDMM